MGTGDGGLGVLGALPAAPRRLLLAVVPSGVSSRQGGSRRASRKLFVRSRLYRSAAASRCNARRDGAAAPVGGSAAPQQPGRAAGGRLAGSVE